MAVLDDEIVRYIEYLQRQLLTAGAEACFDHDTLLQRLSPTDQGIVAYPTIYSEDVRNEYEAGARSFVPRTKFDSYHSQAIFREIQKEVETILADMQLALTRPVHLVTSTDLSPSPVARPSDHEHLLFVGPGTLLFCNYWSKVYSSALAEVARFVTDQSRTLIDPTLAAAGFKAYPWPILAASRLVLFYAFAGTLVGFGPLEQSEQHWAFRMEILKAMEVFIIGHEYAHFIWEERFAHSSTDVAPEEERSADLLAFSICRWFGVKVNSWFAFSGAAPILFFRAIKASEDTRDRVTQGDELKNVPTRGSHPSANDRLAAIHQIISEATIAEQREMVLSYIAEVNAVCDVMDTELQSVFDEAMKKK
jgi:hypothetical protein